MDRKVLAILLAVVLLGGCCVCGVGGMVLKGLGQAGQEIGWLAAAGEAVKNVTQPNAEEMLVLRRLEAGEPLNDGNLAEIERVCRTMAERTRSEWQTLNARPRPPRFANLHRMAQSGALEMETRWTQLAEGVRTRDLVALRRTLAETRAFGDRFRQDVDAELKRLYPAPR